MTGAWSFACLTAPVVTTTSIVLSSNKRQNADILVLAYHPEKWTLSECQSFNKMANIHTSLQNTNMNIDVAL